jgi:hypothetical protein
MRAEAMLHVCELVMFLQVNAISALVWMNVSHPANIKTSPLDESLPPIPVAAR